MVLVKILKLWNNYKYRFVPWLSIHMKDNKAEDSINSDKSVQNAKEGMTTKICVHHSTQKDDSIISDLELTTVLNKLFQHFHYVDIRCNEKERRKAQLKNSAVMYDLLGFSIGKQKSKVSSDAGTGVFIQKGIARKGAVVALYPGTIYLPSEPLFLPSIFNPYIFRCKNGFLVDGHDKRISKSIYKGCAYRDQFSLDTPCCDFISPFPLSPLNVGQYVNNGSHKQTHNVIYQECHVYHDTIPYQFWRYLPNLWYNPVNNNEGLKVIPLVAVRDIMEGEEVLSSYFTIIHD